MPPSANTTDPQKNPASGERRYARRLAISSGRPGRPIGTGNTSGMLKMNSRSFFVIGVSITPGAMAFNRIPAPIQSGCGAW